MFCTVSPSLDTADDQVISQLDKMKIVEVDAQDKDKKNHPHRPRLSEEEKILLWKEKQALKPVLETGISGKVKWYSIRNHYGFIARNDGGKDVFVHQTAILKSRINRYFLRTLDDNEEVLFDVVNGDKGPEAANVTGPDGTDVRGSKYFRILLHPRSRNQNRPRSSEGGDEDKKANGDAKKRRPSYRRNRKSKKTGEENASSEYTEGKPASRRSVKDTKIPGSPPPSKRSESPKSPEKASLGASAASLSAVH